MDHGKIKVIGAKEHNLKSVSIEIPKGKFVVITGPSGSGKSSLALDTLYAEGQRRYVESLSSYARQFLGVSKRPDVERIDGLCPAIAIDQKTVGYNPRSTVGTITEIYDYLRVLFARVGQPHCPTCGAGICAESPERITNMLLQKFNQQMVMVAAPIAIAKKGEFKNDLLRFFNQGYHRFMIDGTEYRFTSEADIAKVGLGKNFKHTISILVDKIQIKSRSFGFDCAQGATLTTNGADFHPFALSEESVSRTESNGCERDHIDEVRCRLQEAIEKAFGLNGGLCSIIDESKKEQHYSSKRICLTCVRSFPELEPRLFSFNSPLGACAECHGLGFTYDYGSDWGSKSQDGDEENKESFWHEKQCTYCQGTRLKDEALAVKVGGKNIAEFSSMPIGKLLPFCRELSTSCSQKEVSESLYREIINRLTFLENVGLDYLMLSRSARTLSGGEGQRIRLATQIGSALSGVLYILDEPSIGLHQRDNNRLIDTLKLLRDQGNTVVVVEHDMDTIRAADYLIDMGPAAGILGGQITAHGSPEQVAKSKNSLTGQYLSGRKSIKVPQQRRNPEGFLALKGASINNLKNLDVQFPLGLLCAVSGVSGSGKSSLVMQTLAAGLQKYFHAGYAIGRNFDEVEGLENLSNMVLVDQSPIGRTPRSNPATYTGIFNDIRDLYASLPESNARGYECGRFSFNVHEGRCFECKGEGSIKVSMHFLEDVHVICKSCNGKRYNRQTLEITYKGKNIADVLEMSVLEACEFFKTFPRIKKRLDLLCEVGLDYIKLGQSATTFSGGEAQRIKLVNELAKRDRKTLYILDEPTTGLHSADVEKLLLVLQKLVDRGNTVLVIEHNLDVLKTADYIIDIGPEGGERGGCIVAQGTPEVVAENKNSITGSFLKDVL